MVEKRIDELIKIINEADYNKVYNVGTKNFGKNNGLFYAKRNSGKMNDLVGEHADINNSLNKDMQDEDDTNNDGTLIYTTVNGHGDQATGTLKELLNK